MRIEVGFGDRSVEFEVPDDRVVAAWSGPAEPPLADLAGAVEVALAAPIEFPPLGLAAVPGDRVAIAFDADGADAAAILGPIFDLFRAAEVESVTVVSTRARPPGLPEGLIWEVHDPDDRARIAYLASTKAGRRIYLARTLTDADLVVPVGRLGHDPALGHVGPWSALYPGLSDREAIDRHRNPAAAPALPAPSAIPVPFGGDDPSGFGADSGESESSGEAEPAAAGGLAEVAEVGWLLGSQLQVAMLPGRSRIIRVLAGLDGPLRAAAIEATDAAWTLRAPGRADLVVAGIGAPGRPPTIDDLADGLAAATLLARRGGKVVALCSFAGPIGPALKRLAGAENPRAAANRLRGREADPDHPAARKLAAAMAHADIYLASGLDRDLVEDLGMTPLDRPESARKLAASAPSITLLAAAERTRIVVEGD